jgi:hypothetical protein
VLAPHLFRALADEHARRIAMPAQSLGIRVEKLERQVSSLEELPGRVTSLELQLLEFRGEVRVEFSAVKTDIQSIKDDVRLLKDDLRVFREDFTARLDQTNRDMRVLHEDVIQRLVLIQEGQAASQVRRRRQR